MLLFQCYDIAISSIYAVCLSVCTLIRLSPAKTDEPIEMPYWMWTLGAQGTIHWVGARIPPAKGVLSAVILGRAQACLRSISQPYSLWSSCDAVCGYHYCNNLLLLLLVGSSSIYRIRPHDAGLTPSGQPASLRCQVATSGDFRLQYVTWFKISRDLDARREFVYHYDRCTGDDVAYGSLTGRARMAVTTYRPPNTVSRRFHRRYFLLYLYSVTCVFQLVPFARSCRYFY